MSDDEPRDSTDDLQIAEAAADKWIGRYTWTQQAGLPADMNRVLRAIWIHGYMAALAGYASEPQSEVEK